MEKSKKVYNKQAWMSLNIYRKRVILTDLEFNSMASRVYFPYILKTIYKWCNGTAYTLGPFKQDDEYRNKCLWCEYKFLSGKDNKIVLWLEKVKNIEKLMEELNKIGEYFNGYMTCKILEIIGDNIRLEVKIDNKVDKDMVFGLLALNGDRPKYI